MTEENHNFTEQDARIVINRKLQEAGWMLEGARRNVLTEQSVENGFSDYLLLDHLGRNLAVIEAKKDSIDPYAAKNQARGYADAHGVKYIFLANSEQVYFWDLDEGDARPIDRFISPNDLERRKELKGQYLALSTIIHDDVIADRPYQKEASNIIAKEFDNGKRSFLLEMATGTGKTRLSAALIKRFLKSHHVERVLFIVDRIELAKQAFDNFQVALGDEYGVARYRPGKIGEWGGASVVVATIQSLNIHFREDFTPGYFDLVFNDEAHRSIYGELPRQVVEYFQATRIGLTATPNDFFRGIDINKLTKDDPRLLELRSIRDTYKHFGCEPGSPTYRYTIQDGVRDGFLVKQRIYKMVSIITEESTKEDGWTVEIDGENYTYRISQLERRVRIPERTTLMCRQFIENAIKSPDGAIGKTIFFAVSQNHAVDIARELNRLAPEHNGKFAEVITSRVVGASDLAKQFRKPDNFYPRVAVSVDMLTTGFDCPELLNVVLARPMSSPTTYIQVKGRGTRKFTFEFAGQKIEKKEFLLHDFCKVVEFFEEEYDFEVPLPVSHHEGVGGVPLPPGPTSERQIYSGPDTLLFSDFIEIGENGERVDRMGYIAKWETEIRRIVASRPEFESAINDNQLPEDFKEYLQTQIFDKPKDYFNEQNLSRAYKVLADLLDFVKAGLGKEKLPTEEEQLDRLVDTLRIEQDLSLDQVRLLRVLVKQLSQSSALTTSFYNGDYSFLNEPPFSTYGGAQTYITQLGVKIKTLFNSIRESSIIRLTK